MTKEVERRKISSEVIDYMQRMEASEEYKNLIYDRYYKDYPEKPFISRDREVNTNWIEMPTGIIPKQVMKRNEDGLLDGHIYMLYWLNKYTNRRIPAYFEYKYGIEFEKEKQFLIDRGYLSIANKPTEKGYKTINKYHRIIENHSPNKKKPTIKDIEKQILEQRDSYIKDGTTMYTFIANSDCCDVCKALNGKHFLVEELECGKNAPPMHEGCRCSTAPYSDRQEFEDWLEHLANGGTTKEWEKLKKRKVIIAKIKNKIKVVMHKK